MSLINIKLSLVLLLILLSMPLLAEQTIDQQLQYIESIQNSNPNKYTLELKRVVKNKKSFNQFQKDFLDYLTYNQQGYKGNFDSALKNLNALFKRTTSKEIKFRCKVKIANIHSIAGNFKQALTALDYVLSELNTLEDKKLQQLGYKIATVVYSVIEENELSKKFSHLILQNKPDLNNECYALTNILLIELRESIDLVESLESRTINTLNLCEKQNNFVLSGLLKTRYLKYRLNLKKSNKKTYKTILKELKNYESSIDNTNYKNLINIKNSLFAEIYWKLNDYEKAKEFAKKTIEQSQSIGNTEQKTSAFTILVNYYKKMQDYESVVMFLEQKNKAENILFKQQQAKFMAYQTVKHENLANTYQIDALNQKNKLLELEKVVAEKSKTNQMLLSLLLASLLLFFIVLIYRIRKQQQKFKKLSELDHMTRVYNRKGISDYMNYILPYSQKKNETITYAIFDLDLFKKINDDYGHVIGDWVIKATIKACQKLNNKKAIFARIGGEEFSITIRDSSIEEITEFAEQCRRAISAIKTKEGTGHDFHITASFGITSTSISGFEYQDLMKHADIALYASKDKGRNCVSAYT